MAALGYELPGARLEEVNQTTTPNPSSSQRTPCFIGKGSPYKRVKYEEITRTSTGAIDQLAYFATGIHDIEACGTQKGLNDIIEDEDIEVDKVTGEISWILNSESKNISGDTYGFDVFDTFTSWTQFDTAVNGQEATEGYQELGLDVVGTLDSGLPSGDTYYFKVNGTEFSFALSSTGQLTYSQVADQMNAQLVGTGFNALFITNDIRVSTDTAGSGNTVTLAAGSSGTDLFASLSTFSAFETAVPGADATSGYQEAGLNVPSSAPSGLAAATRYYFKVNGVEYTFKTTTAPTYAEVVALMHAVVTAAGFSVTFVSSDIRVTNTTTGPTSVVTLDNGVEKVATGGQLRVRLASGVIFARRPGLVRITAVVGFQTYTFGIADDLEVGDTYVTLSGTESQLNALDVGVTLQFATIPKVVGGGKYYVTYRYNRPEDDYKYKEFRNFQDLVDDVGDDLPDHPLVMISRLALQWYNVPKIAVIQVLPTNQNSDYVAALQKCKHRDVQTLGVLNSSGTVRNATIAHVNERSLRENGRYRMYYTGAGILTPLGDVDELNSVIGICNTIKNEKVTFTNATRAKYYYKDPDTGLDTATVVDGAFIGAAIGAYRDSYAYAAQNILGHTIPGLELFEEDYDDYYNDDMLKLAGASSALLVSLGSDNAVFVRDDMTTDNTAVERNNINIITAKHYIAKDVAYQMDRTFTGRLITNRGVYKTTVYKFLKDLFKSYLTARIIEDIGEVGVELPSTRRDTVKIKYGYYAVYTHKYTEGEYSLLT